MSVSLFGGKARQALAFVCALSVFVRVSRAAAPNAKSGQSGIGVRVEDFQVQDALGAERKMSEWSDKRALVVVFLGTECPLARKFAPRLAELSETYAESDVGFVGVHSNRQDTLAEIARFAKEHGLEFPVTKDVGNQVADLFGAERTPEAFVLDQERVVRYRGRIDDQYAVGVARGAPIHRDLANAIDAVLAGKPVDPAVTEVAGCHIGRVRRGNSKGAITYSKQISRILERRCVNCHREGEVAPFAMGSFEATAPWAETIAEVVAAGRMPPWHANPAHGEFLNDATLSQEEKDQIVAWAKDGAPEGDPAELPPPVTYPQGWQIGKPDVVYRMPEPYTIPARGVVEYQYFTIDPGFTEDRWISAAETRPGNREVTHHLILFFHPPGQDAIDPGEALFNSIAAFAPGMPASEYGEETARRVPAGSKLMIQAHYTPNGREQVDQSEFGLIFADPKKVRKEMRVVAALDFRFRIPPGAENHAVRAAHRFDRDVTLYSLTPHMHLRGKSFRFTASYLDGHSEVLLDVPRYDFNWQNYYILATPKLLPEGTVVELEAAFDNSEGNPANPDPSAFVSWGDQTWEEMMIGTMSFTSTEQDLTLGPPQVTALDNGEYEVEFAYRPPQPAQTVHLAGTFNKWQLQDLRLEGPDLNGRYSLKLKLPRGIHEYKFVVDGASWRSDPGNADQVGVFRNSVLRLGN